MRTTVRIALALGVALALALALPASPGTVAQEHPEHPKEAPGKKAPEKVSKEDLAKAIRHYVEEDAKLKGGHFLVYDAAAKKALALTLEKVHDDKLARISDKVYFACADFKEAGGATYDLDIFMELDEEGDLEPTEVLVHKENGKARYTWHEEGGVWKRK